MTMQQLSLHQKPRSFWQVTKQLVNSRCLTLQCAESIINFCPGLPVLQQLRLLSHKLFVHP